MRFPECSKLVRRLMTIAPLIIGTAVFLPTTAHRVIAVPIPADTSLPHLNENLVPREPLNRRIFDRINEFRSRLHLSPLRYDPIVAAVAQLHSEDMARTRNLSHDGFNERFRTLAKTDTTQTVGENIALNFGEADPAERAVRGWLLSDHHLTNIIGKFDATGIGFARAANGEIYFTQLFVTYQ